MFIATQLIDLNWWSLALSEYVLHPFIMITLCLLSVFVVLGNMLVVSAIWHEHQLHSVTNYLIASLAAADCLVGAVVMPFSVISEIIIGSWTFGEVWCDLWHSFDVLASTASIMNLCAISLDRYLAITDPISYPTRMTPRRVALLIVSLWTCSSLISFPAILWWRAVGEGPLQQVVPSIAMNTTTTISPTDLTSPSPSPFMDLLYNKKTEMPQYRCVFTDDPYYLLFSSLISFYLPLCVMLYAYYRIYKAAVQQTRFLKYGSKQVMIGRSKKRKRPRNISEHSSVGACEKNLFTEDACDGTTNMESYDRQHLVLRAHRGGGGGTSVSASISAATTKGSVSSDMIGAKGSNDRKKRENHNSGTVTSKSSPDRENNELPTQRGKQNQINKMSGDLDQSILSKNNGPQQLLKLQTPQSVCSNRNDQIELTSRSSTGSTRRDKLRVDSQRFDSSPSKDTSISANDSGRGNHLDANNSEHDSSLFDGMADTSIEFADKVSMESQEKEIGTDKSKSECSARHKQQRAKPLLSYINDGSTSVDVSIIDHSDLIGHGAQRSDILSTTPARNQYLTYATNCPRKNYQEDSSFIETDERGVDSDEEYDDVAGSDSLSSSSDSYGTGSVASVLVKPEMFNQVNYSASKLQDRSNYDTHSKQFAETKLKRALSYGNEHDCDLSPESRINEIENEDVFISSPDRIPNKLRQSNKPHHRASCGDSSFHLGAFGTSDSRGGHGSRAAKTLNIRSWVKLTRTRRNSSKVEGNQSENMMIKPPPSLMPLMMMNSDTSTDSSILSNVIKRTNRKAAGGKRDKGDTMSADDATVQVDDKNYNIINEHQPGGSTLETNVEVAIDLGRQVNEHVIVDNLTDKNLTFREDTEGNEKRQRQARGSKGQMLFYNSEKLIQSIVDLSAVHYIDCANHNSRAPVGKAIECKAQVVNEAEKKLDLDTSDRVLHLPHGDSNGRVGNVPRNHRSVGKKLSKLAKERKAAKTLGIVVGVFILCWLPFFVVNIVVAICGTNCIYKLQIFFPIVTWLGWLNSAMNPVIYACWSRDFRRAFRRVLCAWVEFVCPYDGAILARKLKLKKSSNYSNQEAYLNRQASSIKCYTSSATVRSVGVSIDGRVYGPANGKTVRDFLSDP